ncbi:hypothetical protein BaRGS_00025223 [Batillaria attramentaria]|uniref:Uncharacterized protein n=1 Tax=Batillaria attramentaria TaxID=370345 RepID=A0ABD0K8W0_9CAEN
MIGQCLFPPAGNRAKVPYRGRTRSELDPSCFSNSMTSDVEQGQLEGGNHDCDGRQELFVGRNIWVIGGMSYSKGISTKMVCYYDIKRRRWRDAFPLPEGSFANLDCCLLQIPADNKDYCFMDRYLYDRWILW